jgi:hypothetical protein
LKGECKYASTDPEKVKPGSSSSSFLEAGSSTASVFSEAYFFLSFSVSVSAEARTVGC